ncbi:MAG: MoaD/ThiS family protein [Acidobacteria bacterium]|jgi:molybdopterin synthase sulfur carrier subunit|nr:MAG: MoaD/ThiS family protein [Acidobacteriota bacterium]
MVLLYFSIVRERLGKAQEEVEFSGSVKQLRRFLKDKYPELQSLWDVVRFAVNEEYVSEDFELFGKERVAIIPPVSGG